MLRFWVCFLSFFYTLNGFSTEKEVETIKCYSCKKEIINIVKRDTKNNTENNDEANYTVEKPFASLSCIFNCKCHSFFLCKECYEPTQCQCPNCNNDNNNNDNNNNDNKGNNVSCETCMETYIKKGPLATYSYFYNCQCKIILCKSCYETMQEKGYNTCPICKDTGNLINTRRVEAKRIDTRNNEEVKNIDTINEVVNSDVKKDTPPISTEEEIEYPKNCCQLCTKCIKACFKN